MNHRYFTKKTFALFLCCLTLVSACNKMTSDHFSFHGLANSKMKSQVGFLAFLRGEDKNREVKFLEKVWFYQIVELNGSKDNYENAKIRLNYYVKGIYHNAEPPYPGAVSKKEECPQQYQPFFFPAPKTNDIEWTAVVGRGTERYVLGACDEKTAKSTILKLVLFCQKSQKVYELEFVGPYPDLPNEDFAEILASFSCTT
jgi:hypothetical protein